MVGRCVCVCVFFFKEEHILIGFLGGWGGVFFWFLFGVCFLGGFGFANCLWDMLSLLVVLTCLRFL